MFNLKEYIKDSSFKIHITNNNTYIDNYLSIDTLNDNLIILIFDTFKLKIEGNNFIIKRLVDKELLFSGYINNINFELK